MANKTVKVSGNRKRRGRKPKSPLTMAIQKARGVVLSELLREKFGDTSGYVLEKRIFDEQLNLLTKVFNGTRPLPFDRLETIESVVPGTKEIYNHVLWDLLDDVNPWSTSPVIESMKRLPARLSKKLFLPSSRYRSGPFERQPQSLAQKLIIASIEEDIFDGLALHIAFFREVEASGDSDSCFFWHKQINNYVGWAVLPQVSKDLGTSLLKALQLGIEETVDKVFSATFEDRDDVIIFSGN